MFKAWHAFWAARFLVTGVAAALALVVIFIFFFCWYRWSKRRERTRKSQEIESTFAERLASTSRTNTASSKIDLGFTSQTDLTSEPKRRKTFSKFFDQLWKGLRTSKRTTNVEGSRRSVVFTIPTDDIFPKCSTVRTQQGLHTHVVQMDDIVTQLRADVHTINEEDRIENNLDDVGYGTSENDLKAQQSSKKLVEQIGEAPCSERMGNETIVQNDKFEGITESNGLKNGALPLDDDKLKESDIENDSGLGSSSHEITTGELPHKYLSLTVTTLSGAQTIVQNDSRIVSNNISRNSDKNIQLDKIGVENGPSCEVKNNQQNVVSSVECLNEELNVQQVKDDDSFSALIQLAKQGMSNTAQDEHLSDTMDPNSMSLNIGHADPLKQVDCDKTSKTKTKNNLGDIQYDQTHSSTYDTKVDSTCINIIVEEPCIDALVVTDDAEKKHVSFCPSASNDKAGDNIGKLNNINGSALTSQNQNNKSYLSVQRLPYENKQYLPVDTAKKTDAKSTNTERKDKQAGIRKKDSATVEQTKQNHLKIPSLEHLPDGTRRPRSFSATIRRRLSLTRLPQSPLDEVDSHGQTKTKKIKGFGSFRMYSPKKSKSTLSDPRTAGLESGDPKAYTCTFDKFFSEDIDTAAFTDVPFTIPEISDE